MRIAAALVLGVLTLSACEAPAPADEGGPHARGGACCGSSGASYRSEAELQAEIQAMEKRWAMWRRRVVEVRAEAMASSRPLPPAVQAEVTELLDREMGELDDEARLRRLSDAVADARRLAELAALD